MNLGQLRTAVQARGYASDTAIEQTEILNSVYRELWSSRPWSWLEATQTIATVVGTSDYTLSPSGQVPLRVHIFNRGTLQPVSPERLNWLHGLNAITAPATTPPLLWTWSRKQLSVYPPPGAVFSLVVTYLKEPAALAADGDSPSDLPAQYHDILVWGTLAELAYRERDHNSYDRAIARFERRQAALIAQEDTIARVRNREYGEPRLSPPLWDPLASQLQAQQQG